jgi:hypothetical protein
MMVKMKKFSHLTFLLLTAIALAVPTTVFALSTDLRPAQQSSTLPNIQYVGQGPDTFTVEAPREFLVKTYQNGEFLFVTDPGPTYRAKRNERVWTTDFLPAGPFRLFDEGISYGNVSAGCVVNYVQIEDNEDDRRNTFFINGQPLQVVEQGMVTYGTFTIPEDGELTFFAEDSIGLLVELCLAAAPSITPPVPSDTPTVTVTETVANTPTDTATPGVTDQAPSATPTTAGGDIIPTDTPTVTQTESVSQPLPSATPTLGDPQPTATSTQDLSVPTASATNTPPTSGDVIPTATSTITLTPNPLSPTATNTQASSNVQATATRTPSGSITLQATATRQATPANIPVTGGGPGPREIGTISAVLLALFGLVAAGWWYVLRVYRRGE